MTSQLRAQYRPARILVTHSLIIARPAPTVGPLHFAGARRAPPRHDGKIVGTSYQKHCKNGRRLGTPDSLRQPARLRAAHHGSRRGPQRLPLSVRHPPPRPGPRRRARVHHRARSHARRGRGGARLSGPRTAPRRAPGSRHTRAHRGRCRSVLEWRRGASLCRAVHVRPQPGARHRDLPGPVAGTRGRRAHLPQGHLAIAVLAAGHRTGPRSLLPRGIVATRGCPGIPFGGDPAFADCAGIPLHRVFRHRREVQPADRGAAR